MISLFCYCYNTNCCWSREERGKWVFKKGVRKGGKVFKRTLSEVFKYYPPQQNSFQNYSNGRLDQSRMDGSQFKFVKFLKFSLYDPWLDSWTGKVWNGYHCTWVSCRPSLRGPAWTWGIWGGWGWFPGQERSWLFQPCWRHRCCRGLNPVRSVY